MNAEANNLSDRCRATRRAALALAGCGLLAASASLAQTPAEAIPRDVERLLDTEPLPPLSLDPTRRYGLLVLERQLLPIERLAAPTIDLAGRRINPVTSSAHAPRDYYGLSLVELASGEETRLPLPRDAVVGYPLWAPDGSRFAFTLARKHGTEIWVGEPGQARAHKLADRVYAAHGPPCGWTADSRRLLCQLVPQEGGVSQASLAAFFEGARQQTALGDPVMVSQSLAADLLESQLVLIHVVSGQRRLIGRPAAFESVRPAPSGAFLLVDRIERPYPRVSGVDIAGHVVEIWDRFGRVVRRLPEGVRGPTWHAGSPATLVWVTGRAEADRVVALPPPFTGEPVEKFKLPHRFGGLRWVGASETALVDDYDAFSGRTEHWLVDMETGSAKSLMSHASNELRWPLTTTNRRGMEAIAVDRGSFFMRGEQDGPNGRRAMLERVSLATGETERIWLARSSGHERLVDFLTADARVLVTKHETPSVPPNYFLTAADGERLQALTHYEHPAPSLAGADHVRLEYTRDDGFDLAASLYLPPGREPGTRLPLIVWAYPRQVGVHGLTKTASEAPRFPTFERAFRLFFLLHGFAVLDDVSMPIVGNGSTANDTFIQQVVANAEAALAAAAETGYVDADRVGVAGHSYGAFMVANLLAHSKLFRAGAALSGAYNRTLTPFGFQTERRTLWEARNTYLSLSPFLFSNQIAAPLLLVHGLNDDNAGTSPLQSTQFYRAIRGNGGDVELLLLPWEGHSYRARESVLSTAAHMLSWFERYLGPPAMFGTDKETGALLRPSQKLP